MNNKIFILFFVLFASLFTSISAQSKHHKKPKSKAKTVKTKKNSQQYLNIRITSTSGPTEAVLTLEQSEGTRVCQISSTYLVA